MISLTTFTTLFYFTTIKMKSLTKLTTLSYFTTLKRISLTTLTTPFYFTTLKMISLNTLTRLFYFTTLKMISVTMLSTLKMKSLTTLTTLSYLATLNLYYTSDFITINPSYHTGHTMLLLPAKYFPQEFQCFHQVCMCHSDFTVRNFSGVLHALVPKKLVSFKFVTILLQQYLRHRYCKN